jgi:hypothetical protein
LPPLPPLPLLLLALSLAEWISEFPYCSKSTTITKRNQEMHSGHYWLVKLTSKQQPPL